MKATPSVHLEEQKMQIRRITSETYYKHFSTIFTIVHNFFSC